MSISQTWPKCTDSPRKKKENSANTQYSQLNYILTCLEPANKTCMHLAGEASTTLIMVDRQSEPAKMGKKPSMYGGSAASKAHNTQQVIQGSAYGATSVSLTNELKTRLKNAYNKNVHWKKVQQRLHSEEADHDTAEDYQYSIGAEHKLGDPPPCKKLSTFQGQQPCIVSRTDNMGINVLGLRR
jgi:hypothetical protein